MDNMDMIRQGIELHFQNMLNCAGELETLNARIRKITNQDILATEQNLAAGWKGESANAFIRACELARSEVSSNSASITSVAATIRRVAKTMHDAEVAAWQIAANRKYG